METMASSACHCAGCGAPLPKLDSYPPADDLRCNLCWRAMLAAEAAMKRQDGDAQALAPWFELVIRGVLTA